MSGIILNTFLDLLSHLIGSTEKAQVELKFDCLSCHSTGQMNWLLELNLSQ